MAQSWEAHRPVVMGMHGMVSTGHSLASTEALRVLIEGGNAMDAALAAAFVLAVVKSYHCGLGGDAFLLFYSAKERKVYALNGSGRSPVNLQTEQYRTGIPKRGILAAAVPGAVDAWLEAAEKFASRDVKTLARPAIRYALDGFPVFPNLEKVIASSAAELGEEAAWRKIFLPHGRIPRSSELLKQVDLGRSLEEIAEQGHGVFYEGRIAEAIVGTSRDKGGSLCERDLREHRSRWEEPIHCGYKGLDVYVPPPNSYGLLLLLQLKLLSDHELAPLGHNTAESLDVQLKMKEKATLDGDPWIADPDRFDRQSLDEWVRDYPNNFTNTCSSTGNRALGRDTTYIATADGEGNWTSLIQSVHQGFGCGVVVEGTGIVLNNRMPGFNLISGHPNELAPDKLPAHTLSPCMVLKEGVPIMAIGTPGGMGQTQFLTQMLANIFDYGMNIQQAIEAPRWQSEMAGKVEVERRFAPDAVDALKKQGYDVKVVGPWDHAMGGAEVISRDAHSKVFMGAADPRRDGYAIGY